MKLLEEHGQYVEIVNAKNAEQRFVELHPDWKNDLNKRIFLDHLEPATDPIEILKEAIQKSLVNGDIVLSTPHQVDFFQTNDAQEVHIFDISLGQLVNKKIRDVMKGVVRDYWWIDLFDEKMLQEALLKSNITVLYASNIVEWALNHDQLESLARVINNSTVKTMMFSVINKFNSNNSQFFIKLMMAEGWEKEVVSNTKGESIVTMRR